MPKPEAGTEVSDQTATETAPPDVVPGAAGSDGAAGEAGVEEAAGETQKQQDAASVAAAKAALHGMRGDAGDEDSTGGTEGEKADEPSGLSDAQVTEAKAMGFSDEEVKGLTPDALLTASRLWDRKIAALGRGKPPAEPAKPPETPPKQDAAPPPEKKGGPPKPAPNFDRIREELGDEIAGVLQDSYESRADAARLGQIEAALKTFGDFMEERNEREFTDQYDAWLKKLGPEWDEVLGKESVDDLKPDNPRMKNREKHIGEFRALLKGYSEMGVALPPDEILKRALYVAFGDIIKKQVTGQLARNMSDRARGAIKPPAARQRTAAAGEREAAIAAVRKKQQDMGLTE